MTFWQHELMLGQHARRHYSGSATGWLLQCQNGLAAIPRKQQDVALPLVIPLGVKMFDVFAQCPPQGPLAKEDHLGQALLLDRPDPALRIGIQVRADFSRETLKKSST